MRGLDLALASDSGQEVSDFAKQLAGASADCGMTHMFRVL